jgi:hypothetical protein
MSNDEVARRQQERREAAAEHARALERQKAAETAQARVLIAGFAQQARERGLRPAALTARAQNGRAQYRTRLTGWYLRHDHSLAVGVDGEFYILTVPTSMRSRLTGADVPPADPPLVVGAGGRDGDSIPLQDLLQLRLDAGNAGF